MSKYLDLLQKEFSEPLGLTTAKTANRAFGGYDSPRGSPGLKTRSPAQPPIEGGDSEAPSKPPPITEDDQTAINEAIEERAAIREYDGGEDRETAEREAQAAMRVFRYRLSDHPDSWLILIAPGCDLAEARRSVEATFGAGRVLEVIAYSPTPRDEA